MGNRLLTLVVRAFGCDVRTVYDGAAAVHVTETFRPHVVFLDLGMPGIDGLDAARRALTGTNGTLLVAVTGWGQERDRQLTSEAGFDAHLVKPADPLVLRALIARAPVDI